MIIDVNAWVGHWPFRQLRHNTVQGLLRLMDRSGIDRAVVASIHGVFYRNPHSANEELARQVMRHRDRLIPFATLNPAYAGWEEDLRRCAEDLELCGIRLYPQYHGYEPDSDEALDFLDAVADRGWPVQVPMRIVDRRQRHPWDLADDLKPATFRRLFNLRPHIRWMILNGAGFTGRILPPDVRFLVDVSRLTAVLERSIQGLTQAWGNGCLAFGSGMPFNTPAPALLKLQILDAPDEVREAIAWRNADTMLRRPLSPALSPEGEREKGQV